MRLMLTNHERTPMETNLPRHLSSAYAYAEERDSALMGLLTSYSARKQSQRAAAHDALRAEMESSVCAK